MATEIDGRSVQALDGESFAQSFRSPRWAREAPLFWEHEGNSAVRVGDFKLVREHGKKWELYDMHEDRTELHDLAGTHAPLEQNLVERYDEWADRVGARDWGELEPIVQAAWGMDDLHG